MDYQIKAGDTLCGIARSQYGITNGAEAYRKALEIAKDNGIQNPNLIFAGTSIVLKGLDEENKGDTFERTEAEGDGETPTEPAGNEGVQEPSNVDPAVKSAYDEYYAKDSNAKRHNTAQALNADGLGGLSDEFKMPDNYNPETDGDVQIVGADHFKQTDGTAVRDGYAQAVQGFGQLDIQKYSLDGNDTMSQEEFTLKMREMYDKPAAEGAQRVALQNIADFAGFNPDVQEETLNTITALAAEVAADESTYNYNPDAANSDYGVLINQILTEAGVGPDNIDMYGDGAISDYIVAKINSGNLSDDDKAQLKGIMTTYSQMCANNQVYNQPKAAVADVPEYAQYDTSGDGYLDASEIYAVDFSVYDVDGNGELSDKELGAIYATHDAMDMKPNHDDYLQIDYTTPEKTSPLYFDGHIDLDLINQYDIDEASFDAVYESLYGKPGDEGAA